MIDARSLLELLSNCPTISSQARLTRLIENGVSAIELMGLRGHTRPQTPRRYVVPRPDDLRSAVGSHPAYELR